MTMDTQQEDNLSTQRRLFVEEIEVLNEYGWEIFPPCRVFNADYESQLTKFFEKIYLSSQKKSQELHAGIVYRDIIGQSNFDVVIEEDNRSPHTIVERLIKAAPSESWGPLPLGLHQGFRGQAGGGDWLMYTELGKTSLPECMPGSPDPHSQQVWLHRY